MGRIWGAWVGVGLLVGGIVGNGVSRLIWPRGVPDFIDMGREVWNVADFEIGLGLTGGIVSIAVSALLIFVRERLGAPGVGPDGGTASGA
jgi:lipoprotein signal peptidase